jgi:hypothetical protein
VATVALRSGVEVVGRGEDDAVLDHWDVVDPASGKAVAHVWQRWGFTAVPPGRYALRLRPRGHEAVVVPWGEVTVEAEKTARVEVTSGVEVVGRGVDEGVVLAHWEVVDKTTGKPVAHAWQRWGFTPVLPGTYTLRLLPRGYEALAIDWGDVTVETGRVTRVEISSGVEVVGRTPEDRVLEHWEVVDRSGKPVAHVWQRWGFTPVLPGTYSVRLRPHGPSAIELPWAEVEVGAGRASVVKVDSGIAVLGRPGQDPVEYWVVFDAKSRAPVAKVYQRWGFTPLPPGVYDVERIPRRWRSIEVKPGEVATLEEPDLEARWATISGAGRKTERERDPEAWRKLEEEVERAVRRGAAWLEERSEIKGMDLEGDHEKPTIGILALVHAGELERDRELGRRATDFLRRRPLNGGYSTYATSITAMALRDLGARRHLARLHECATWLVENQGWGDDPQLVWGYGDKIPGFDDPKPPEAGRRPAGRPPTTEVVRRGLATERRPGWDNSNAQFAVLGLHATAQARIGVPKESWTRVERHFREVQSRDKGWGYSSGGSTGSMTCSAVASLVIARHHLGVERPALDPQVLDGMEWLDFHFTVEENPNSGEHYYYLYGLERVGVLAGTEFVGEHEWYPVGARYLLGEQRADGSWQSGKSSAGSYLDTCYAILFLRRATLPLETEAPAYVGVKGDEAVLVKHLPAVELIFDSSGSMKDRVEGRPKIEIARAVLAEALAGLSSDVQVGLRLYGHRHVWIDRSRDPRAPALDPSDPRVKLDSELVVPIGRLDERRRADIRRRIQAAQPLGWTPMVHSLLEARKDFPDTGRAPRTVVLVSDGEETGGGRLEDVAAAYQGSGIEMTIHVVGFDIAGTPAERQLQEIARIGKGRYYGARNARELSEALRAAVPSLGFEVRDPADVVVARGSLNADPVEVKPGAYRVRLVGFESAPTEVRLEEGQEATLVLDEDGKLVPEGS